MSVVLPLEVEAKVRYLVTHTGETKTALLARLILGEWERRGCPIPDRDDTDKGPDERLRDGVSCRCYVDGVGHVHRQAP